MKILRRVLFILFASIATTPLMADSSNFAGPYIGIQGSAVGVELEGEVTTGSDKVRSTSSGTIGKTALIAGGEIGYAFPIGSMGVLDIGATYIDGSAKLKTSNTDTAASADVTFEVSDVYTVYIAPTIVLSDTSSLYLKGGLSQATVKVTGDVSQPADLSGETYAVGTRTVLESGLFIRTEAGITTYNGISAHGLGAGGTQKAVAKDQSHSAEPTVAYGAVSIGFKF